MEIKNNTDRNLNFRTGVKDGAVVTDHVGPGETKDVKVMDPNDPEILGLIAVQAITVKSPTGDARKAQESAKAGTDVNRENTRA